MTQNKPRRFRLTFDPQATAWMVVSVSFVVFCLVCAASTFGVWWFVYQSGAPLTVRLTVSRGAVTMILPDKSKDVINGSKDIVASGTILTTDSNSQAYLTFEDSAWKQQLGIVFLRENSTISLDEAARPQFEWSNQDYQIMFSGPVGHFAVDIFPNLHRAFKLHINSPAGTAYMANAGSYNIHAIAPYIRLHPTAGKGILYASPTQGVRIETNMIGTLYQGETFPKIQSYPYTMLNLENPGPPQNSLFDSTVDSDKLANQWGCTNDTPQNLNEVEGTWKREVVAGIPQLSISRIGQNLKHAQTSCEFYFPQKAQDITGYKTLSIQLKMKIADQDITTCGIVGSECPIMLMLEYFDANGDNYQWRQGFYVNRPPDDTSVPRCDTCPHDHIQLNQHAWYIYDSGDLKIQFTPGKEPATLLKVSVYSSGHQFDVAVQDVSVLGGTGEILTGAEPGGSRPVQ
jgi:hypothetical protein